MAVASLIAFGTIFVCTCLGLSLLFTVSLLSTKKSLRRSGAWVERRAAAAALVLPPLLALGLVAVLAADSALALTAGTDHCLDHVNHHHICLSHGSVWMSHPWALGLVTSAAAFVGLRFTCLLWGHVKAQRVVARLRSLSEPIGRRAYLVPIDERFAFTAGLLSSTVFFSRAAWEVLRPEQREAILAHELAHIDHDDIRCRAALGCAASFGVPLLVRSALRLWERSTERICDREAALAVDRPSTVASAMLALIRPAPLPLAPEGSLHAAASDLPERIEAVLREEPSGERLSQLLVLALGAASASFAIACGAFVTPIHHALETILG